MDDPFIRAYHDFRDSVDFTRSGLLPDVDNLVWYLVMGVPRVPADEDPEHNAPIVAVEQRITILKAVFVEANRHETEAFLDEGLDRYDEAGKTAKTLLTETMEGKE